MNNVYPKEIPPNLQEKLNTLAELDLDAFLREYSSSKKSKPLAFWLLLPLGLHYAYIGRWWLSVAFIFTCGGIVVWWLVDLFRVRQMIGRYNENLAFALYRKYKG